MKDKWSSLVKTWTIVAVVMSQTVTAKHLSGNMCIPFSRLCNIDFVL